MTSRLTLALGFAVLAGACADAHPLTAPSATAGALAPSLGLPNGDTADTLDVGGTVQLSGASLAARKGKKPTSAVAWTSSAPSVATVSGSGLVRAVAPGTAVITAANNMGSEQARVLVRAAAPPPTAAQAVLSFVGPTLPAANVEARGGDWARYEQDFRTYAERRWAAEGASYTGNYYDRASIYYAWWARTGNPVYLERANAIAVDYRTNQVEASGYALEPREAQFDGLVLHYLVTGDEASRVAVGRMAEFLTSPTYSDRIGDTTAITDTRTQARIIMGYVSAWYVKAPSPSGHDWAALARGALDRTLSTQSADGAYRFRIHCYYNKPFMNGMLNDAMIRYAALFERDPRILPSVKKSVDYLWASDWVPSAQGFLYMGGECTEGRPTPTPDLNALIVTGYGWVGRQTGDSAYFARGDAVFNGAVRSAWLDGSKQFNQAYVNSYRYFATRF